MKIFCAYKGKYPNGMAMANRLKCYSKALGSGIDHFTVATEGQRDNGGEFQQILPNHNCWYWRKESSFDRLPIVKYIYSSWKRWKIYRHILKSKDVNVVFSSGYRWPQMLIFAFMAHLSGKKYCIELNEWPHSIVASRKDSETLNKLKRWLTFRLAFPKIDGFIAISENLKELALKYAGSKAHVIKVPILTDYVLEGTRNVNREEPFIFHAGTLTREKDGIIEVLEGFGKAVIKTDLKLNFEFSNYVTLPDIKRELQSIIERYDIQDRIIFHDHLKPEELRQKYQSCSMAVINKPNNERNRFNFSTKLGEYMSYGIPLITSDVGESGKYLKDGENCLLIGDSRSSDEIAIHITRLSSNSSLAEELGENARRTALDHFDYRNHSAALIDYFNSL